MMPREELLASRRIGEGGARLLYRMVRRVAISRGFPPPDGSVTWDEAACQECAHDFIQGKRGAKRLLELAARSIDERSFERLLETAVHNHLRDVSRSTPMGKLIVRVKEVLRESADFVSVAGASGELWALAGGPSEPSNVMLSVLAASIRRTSIRTPKWSSETRDAPLADRESFVRLIQTLLKRASGSLNASDIADVLATRLDIRRAPLTIELDGRVGGREPVVAGVEPGSVSAGTANAQRLFGSMSDRERIIFSNLEASVRDLAATLGIGKSQAAQIRQRLMDRLQSELCDDDARDETVAGLSQLCDLWIADWTTGVGSTSDSDMTAQGGDRV